MHDQQVDQDRVVRAYARLTGLQKRIDENEAMGAVYMPFVQEFHEGLDHLRSAGFDVEEFRVKRDQLKEAGPGEMYVPRAMILAKLDAVLTYFNIVNSKPNPQLGFHGRAR